MIPKLTSSELNNILEDAQSNIQKLNGTVQNIQAELETKIAVIRNENEYSLAKINTLNSLLATTGVNDYSDKIVFANSQDLQGTFDKFGACVHPKFSAPPVNVFNFITSSGPVYKDNATIKVNDASDSAALEILKHDAVPGKGIFFNEYSDPKITLEIEVDTGKLTGETRCNMLEIVPFLPGSFKIDSIQILETQSHLTGQTAPDCTMNNLGDTGACRIILPDTYDVFRLKIMATVMYQNLNGKYPFGIKHLYLYNASFVPKSFVVARTTKDNFIDAIDDGAILFDQSGSKDVSLAASGIKLYLTYEDGVPGLELPTSDSIIQQTLSRNTKEFYAVIPIVNTAIVAMQYNKIFLR